MDRIQSRHSGAAHDVPSSRPEAVYYAAVVEGPRISSLLALAPLALGTAATH